MTPAEPAAVSLRGEGTLTPLRTGTTDAQGLLVLSAVTPAVYDMRVERAGFKPAVDHVTIEAGDELIIRVDFVATTTDEGTVSRITIAHRTHGMQQITISGTWLRALPASGTIWSLIETLEPFTVTDRMDTGGTLTGQTSLVGGHASSWTQTGFRLDTLDITDRTEGGSPLAYPDPDGLDTISVISGLMPIELQTPGPVITMLSRRPSTTFHGAAQVAVTPGPLQARGPVNPPPIARLESWRDANLTMGGPLVDGHIAGFLSTGLTQATRTERNDPTEMGSNVASIFTHTVFLPTGADQVQLVAAAQRTRRPFAGRARLADWRTDEVVGFTQVQMTWSRVQSGGTTWSLEGGVDRARNDPRFDGTTASGVVERLRDGPVPGLALETGGTHARWTVGLHGQPALSTIGGRQHTVRFGLTASGSSAALVPLQTGPIAELVDGLPARIWDYNYAGRSRWRETMLGIYAGDRIEVTPRLVVDAGLRFDSTTGGAVGAPQDISWRNGSPRLSGRWSFANGDGSVLIGVGRYQYALPLDYLAYGDPNGPQGLVYRWIDRNSDGFAQANERGALIARVGPGSMDGRASIDPHLQQPHTDEIVIGIERTMHGWTGRFDGVAHGDNQLVAAVNQGVPLSAYTVSFIPDTGLDVKKPIGTIMVPVYNRSVASFGQDRVLLTNPSGLQAWYKGLELTVESPRTRSWQILFGATAGKSAGYAANRGSHVFENDQGVIGELFDNPNATTFGRGRLFFERGYTIKLAGLTRLPHEMTLSGVARYLDGQHFARLVIAPDLNQGPEAIRAFQNGLTRFTYTLTVDGRLERRFVTSGRHWVAAVEGFNLLNMKNEVEEYAVTGPSFRATTAVQPPRVIRLSARLEF